jgi:hypothetical protein
VPHSQATQTLAVMVATTADITLALAVVSIVTGGGWWVTAVLAAVTAFVSVRYLTERRRFGDLGAATSE